MYYTASNVQEMAGLMRAKLTEMIQAKKDIQNSLLAQATSSEAMALAMNTVPASLVSKLKTLGRQYLNKTARKDVNVLCVAMAVGTIIKELDNGIIIDEAMGLHSGIDVKSGNISIPVSGYLVENGVITKGVDMIVLSTNIFELLSNVISVGNDLSQSRIDVLSPSLLLNNIAIAGGEKDE